jgi:hypothetical protein
MVKVLFIAGWLRSGTTVTGNVLGSTPGAIHIGELNYLWMKEHPAGFECGCGQVIFECPVWRPVFEKLGMTTERRYEIRQLRRDAWRNDDVPRRYWDWRRDKIDLGYPEALGEVYAALVDQPGVDVVVDSTKNPSDALAAALAPGVDLHLLHVVRDPRAAAYSGMQEKSHGSDSSGHQMVQFSASRNTFHWDVRNLLIERCVKPAVAEGRYRRVRYEDLMATPRTTFGQIADWVGLDPAGLPFSDESTLRMTRSHTVMGNPNRHSDGDTTLRLDTRWVDKLGRRDRRTAALLASPLMTRYGYPLRSGGSQEG